MTEHRVQSASGRAHASPIVREVQHRVTQPLGPIAKPALGRSLCAHRDAAPQFADVLELSNRSDSVAADSPRNPSGASDNPQTRDSRVAAPKRVRHVPTGDIGTTNLRRAYQASGTACWTKLPSKRLWCVHLKHLTLPSVLKT